MLMQFKHNRPLAIAALVPMIWFSIEGLAWSATYRTEKHRRARIEKMAENLGVPVELLEDPQAFRAEQIAARQAARPALVARYRDSQREDLSSSMRKAKVRLAATQDKLAAAFLHMNELTNALDTAASSPDPVSRNRAAAMARTLIQDAWEIDGLLVDQEAVLQGMQHGSELVRRLAPVNKAVRRYLQPMARSVAKLDMTRAHPAQLRLVANRVPKAGQKSASEATKPIAPTVERVSAKILNNLKELNDLKPTLDAPEPMLGATQPPAAADTDPAPEGQVTPEIQALADALGHDPLAIYNWVRTECESELYYGGRKGASGALTTLSGNDADLSALLVALLRASGIPARYRAARVRLSASQAMQMAGTEDVRIAGDAFASAGIPAYLHWVGSELKGLVVEHVYVAAYVPYSNYRGVAGPESKPMWIELDPWLVPHTLTPGTDLADRVAFDRMAYLSQVTDKGPLDTWEDDLIAWARANGRECENLDFAMRKRIRSAQSEAYLPAEVPADKVASLWEDVALPAAMQTTVEYSLRGESDEELASAQVPGYQVFGVPAQLAYEPATAADQELIETYGDLLSVPPYLLRLRPRLVAATITLFEGGPAGPGQAQTLKVTVTAPGLGTRTAHHPLISGTQAAAVWLPGPVPARVLNEQELALTQAIQAGETDRANRIRLGLAVLGQLHDDAASMAAIAGLYHQRVQRQINEGAAFENLAVTHGFMGVPVSIEKVSTLLDIPLNLVTQHGLEEASNQPAAQKRGMTVLGLQGSHLERTAFERQFEGQGYSTVLALQSAAAAGQSIQTIDQTNVGSILPTLGLPGEVKQEIQDAVAAGNEVLTPEAPVSAAGFDNAVGYIVEDPAMGTGSYRIGTFALSGCEGGSGAVGGSGDGLGTCPCACEDFGSSLNLANGNYYHTETDLMLPAVGIPVAFSRRYNSNQYSSGDLGPGWTHSYELRLTENPDGTVDFVNEEGLTFTFGFDGAVYSRPDGRNWDLERNGAGWLMRLKGGMVHGFDASGRLAYTQDLNGNRVELTYSAGKLDHVSDATGRQALTFAYDANGQLESVTDVAGRTVGFGHDGEGDLVSVTDVLGATKAYSYDADHHLVSKTDYNGNTHTYAYDARGRCYRHEDPLGAVKTVSYDYMHRQAVVTDALGNETLHVQDEGGRPVEVVDPLGNSKRMTWDADNNKLTQEDGRGLVTSFTYDPRGNLETRTAPGQGTTTYTYDPLLDRVLTITDAEGGQTINTYDAAGNLDTSQDAEGELTGYTYSPSGLPDTITRPGGATTTLGYDPAGNLETLLDAEGGLTVLGYDLAGHITSVTDPNTHTRTLEVDDKGRVEAIVDPQGNRNSFTYDDQGNRLTMTDAAGKVTTFTYNENNQLLTVTDALGHQTRNEYDLLGRLSARIDAKGNRTEYRYDAAGRLTDVIAADGGVTSLGYCADVSQTCSSGCTGPSGSSTSGGGSQAAGATKACAIIDPEGNLTTVGYDEAGRPTEVTDPLGHAKETTYDDLGRKTLSTDAMGKQTEYRYTPSGRLWQVIDALGGITEYGYDHRGNREMVRDANGHETWFEYDLMDRLVREINPLGHETVFTYDAGGNRDTKLDPKGNLITYQYDENRRLTDIIYPDATRTHFDFDERGNKVYEENPSISRTYTYTDLNQVETVTDHVLNKTLTYAYGPNGNRSRMEGPSGEVSQYRYDALNRIRELVDPDGGRTVFSYSPSGRREGLTFPNGVQGTYLWDQAGRLESIVYAKGAGDVLSSFTYTHDDAGNRLSKTLASGGSESYGYDDLHRLTSAAYPSGRSVTYDYDPVGNRNFVIEQFAGGSSETTTYSYSDFNQVLSTTNSQGTTDYGWDDNGNLVSKQTPLRALTQYSYNYENRLSSILFPSGQTNAFGYDPQGIRTFKEDSEGVNRFLIDRASVLATFDGAGVQKNWLNHNPQRIDEVISQVQEAGKLFHLIDGLGSVYGLVNQAGVKVASYGYDAYGALTDAQVEPGLKNNWLFTGRELDADSGWQYNRARYYLAGLGGWNREDPLNLRSRDLRETAHLLHTMEGVARYSYSRLGPTLFRDPSGAVSDECWRAIKDFVLSVLDATPFTKIFKCWKGWEFLIDVLAFVIMGMQAGEAGLFDGLWKDQVRFWLTVISIGLQVIALVVFISAVNPDPIAKLMGGKIITTQNAWISILILEAASIAIYSYGTTGSINPLEPCFRDDEDEAE